MRKTLSLSLIFALQLPASAQVVKAVPSVSGSITPIFTPGVSAHDLVTLPLTINTAAPSLTPSLVSALIPIPAGAVPTFAAIPATFASHPLLSAASKADNPAGHVARAAKAATEALATADFSDAAKVDILDLPELTNAAKKKAGFDYVRMFALARETMKRPTARRFLREVFKKELTLSAEKQKEFGMADPVKDFSESQLMFLLQNTPELWTEIEAYLKAANKEDKADPDEKDTEFEIATRAKFRALLADPRVLEVFQKFNDPLTPMRLDTADGKPGYRNARVYANHKQIVDGKELPAEDLRQVLIDFIAGAETELMFNVFDFDLMDVADALIARAKAGVVIHGGIDMRVIAERPEVKAVFEKLSKVKNIKIRPVDSVGLNHQKIMIRDFNDEKKAKALFSSGNFTQSCIGPEGDLKDLAAGDRPKDSVPNANHIMVLDSFLLAQVVANSLTKTLIFGLRGQEYPLDGAYRVLGADGQWIILSFSPHGGLGDINRDMTGRLITSTKGPLRLLQFAFSSTAVRDAIIERAKIEGKDFDLKTVGDTPFAMRPWSVFLELAGYALKEDGPVKEYVEAAANALKEALGAERYEAIRANLRVGPHAYGNHVYKEGEAPAIQYNSKIHHKVLISGDYAVLGTSFNFSEAANSNQEQFLVTSDKALVAAMTGIFDGLFSLAATTLTQEAIRRNERFKQYVKEDDGGDDKQYDHVDKEARRSRGK
jgi:hypothetical protein